MKKTISLTVNGQQRDVLVEQHWSLLYVLREILDLTGTKQGCDGTGECGACTVILNGAAVPSCLVLAVEANEKEIITIEGIAKGNKLDPIQQAFIEVGAVQCGYCTPGMIMMAKDLLNNNTNPTEAEIKQAISGNICRCTGYVKIVEAIKLSSKNLQGNT